MTVKGVFFDLYGTLLIYGDMVRAWDDWLSAFYDSVRGFGLSMSRETFAFRCQDFFARPEPLAGDDGLTVLGRRVQTFCRELGLELAPTAVEATGTAFVRAWQQHVSLDPDARPVLEVLKESKTLALVSNFDDPPHVRSLLADLGLSPFFDAVVISGDVGVKKPSPEIFSHALRRTDLRPEDVVHVGDTDADLAGARSANLRPILIRRPRADDDPVVLDYAGSGQRLEADSTSSDGTGAVTTISSLPELLKLV